MPPPLPVTFVAGPSGAWRIDRLIMVRGATWSGAARLDVIEGADCVVPADAAWVLRGVTSNTRYTHRAEVTAMAALPAPLRRPQATRAALIPISKSQAWWDMAQDERRAVFEEQSRHIGIGMEYMPAVARRLHHSRELGEVFDFLTWFEFAREHEAAFDAMLARLRATAEWRYVDREVDIRLSRD